MGGPQVYAEKQKKEVVVIKSVEFKSGGKTYVAQFKKPPKIKDIPSIPKGETAKEIAQDSAKVAEKYGVVIDEKGKKAPVKNPSTNLKATAGKTLMGEKRKKTMNVKNLVPKLAQ
jgi:thioredoxin reductase